MKRIIAVLLLLPCFAIAQGYPTKPIHLVVGYPPAGAMDILARLIGDELAQELGTPVIIDNRPGAAGTIAADAVAKSPADGHTLFITTAGLHGSDALLYKNLKYDAERDFSPITRLVALPMILAVNKDLGIRTVPELIARARAQRGKFNYASSGNAGSPHLAGGLFARVAGLSMEHVPFKGGAPAVQSVIAGDTQLTFATAPSVVSFIDSGRLLGLAVSSRKRSPALPSIPGMEEAGLAGYDLSFAYGLYAAGKPPAAVIERLFRASLKVLAKPELKEKLARQGMEAVPSASPAEFLATAKRDGAQLVELIRESGVKLE
jgi:tripartite-type tricarboxylate transporter receptor subunit TctC